MTSEQTNIFPGLSVVRQINGTPGVDEIQLYHNGSYGAIESMFGNLVFLPNSGSNLILDIHKWPNADGLAGQAISTDGAGNLSFNAINLSNANFGSKNI